MLQMSNASERGYGRILVPTTPEEVRETSPQHPEASKAAPKDSQSPKEAPKDSQSPEAARERVIGPEGDPEILREEFPSFGTSVEHPAKSVKMLEAKAVKKIIRRFNRMHTRMNSIPEAECDTPESSEDDLSWLTLPENRVRRAKLKNNIEEVIKRVFHKSKAEKAADKVIAIMLRKKEAKKLARQRRREMRKDKASTAAAKKANVVAAASEDVEMGEPSV
ncbi:hypothetical protein B0H21DRAFT_822146 [Amylocystis lapponica]|nr:hypothetical protein B0H21DRAFT_822146 [Amylocystis lapponica]